MPDQVMELAELGKALLAEERSRLVDLLLESFPQSGAPSHKGTRRRIVRGFPFSIVDRASDAELLIVAVAPHRRQPEYWSGRVK